MEHVCDAVQGLVCPVLIKYKYIIIMMIIFMTIMHSLLEMIYLTTLKGAVGTKINVLL